MVLNFSLEIFRNIHLSRVEMLNLALFLPLQSSKLSKEIRSTKNTKKETFEERDIKMKELKDCKKAVNKKVLEVMEHHPDLQGTLQTYFMEVKNCTELR